MGRHNKSFVENFWVEDINSTAGFDVLSNRMRDGRKLCKEIDDYLRQRSKIEAQYVKELQKLNKQDNKEDLGGLEMAWKEMKQQTERIAHHHDVAAKHFLNIANEISIFNTEQKKVTKEWEDKVSKLHSAAKNTYAKVNNQYKVYDNKFNENTAADAALKYNEKHSDGITPKEMEKTRTKADKARDELEKTDTLYKTLVKQVQEEMSTWEKEMSGLCKKFQDLDEQRIDHLRDYLWKCTNIDSQANIDHDQCCENVRVVLEKCNIDNDIDHFITKHKTGNRHPARVEYKGHSKVSTPVINRRLPSIPKSGSHIYDDVS